MSDKIYPCLWFDHNAKEASDFYCSIFNDSRILTNNPMVSIFELNGKKIMGINGGSLFKINQSISLYVTCPGIEELNELWNKFSIEGKVMMPIDRYPWSERYGWIQDRFGMTWQLTLSRDDEQRHITPSLLFTGKLFGKAEEAVRFYTSVFEKSSIPTLLHYPDKDYGPGKVLFSEFLIMDETLIAMDGPGEHAFSFNEALSFVVDCDTQQEIDYFWERLTQGGSESQCGWLKDKFGISWQIIPSILGKLMSDPAKAPRIVAAFMKMKKFDIEIIKNA